MRAPRRYVYTAIDAGPRESPLRGNRGADPHAPGSLPAAVHITDIGCGDDAFTWKSPARYILFHTRRGPAAGLSMLLAPIAPGHIAGIVSFEPAASMTSRIVTKTRRALASSGARVLHHLDDRARYRQARL